MAVITMVVLPVYSVNTAALLNTVSVSMNIIQIL